MPANAKRAEHDKGNTTDHSTLAGLAGHPVICVARLKSVMNQKFPKLLLVSNLSFERWEPHVESLP